MEPKKWGGISQRISGYYPIFWRLRGSRENVTNVCSDPERKLFTRMLPKVSFPDFLTHLNLDRGLSVTYY
jgi:hypothetical protein